MTIRKLHRLMSPADGEGFDLGGAIEQAAEQVGVQPDEAPRQEPLPDGSDAAIADTAGAASEPRATDDARSGDDAQKSRLHSLLDELTDDPNAPKAKEPEPEPAAQEQIQEGEPKPRAEDKPDQEVAELLEGVKSDRGRERIRKVFEEKKALEKDINDLRQLVASTRMTPEQFAQTLEFGRLVNSGDEKDLRVALEMVETQRAMLYAKLGVEAPGVDLLQGHDDLKRAVENMEITREHAVELAKHRRQQAEAQQRQQIERQIMQQREAFQQTVQKAAQSMEAYLQTRAHEVDHPARMKIITEYFRNPDNLQRFVATFQPEQWPAAIQMMYDNIQVPRTPSPQPIRSRPAALGTPAASAANPMDRILQRMESMGL